MGHVPDTQRFQVRISFSCVVIFDLNQHQKFSRFAKGKLKLMFHFFFWIRALIFGKVHQLASKPSLKCLLKPSMLALLWVFNKQNPKVLVSTSFNLMHTLRETQVYAV